MKKIPLIVIFASSFILMLIGFVIVAIDWNKYGHVTGVQWIGCGMLIIGIIIYYIMLLGGKKIK